MTDQAPTTPDSVVVPVEPTREMIDAAFDAFEIDDPKQYETGTDARNAIYRAMLAARPAATPGGEREAIARWRGKDIPYDCPFPSVGVSGAPYGYNVDPGAGSAMDRLQRQWPDRAQVRDLRERDGEITPLFPLAALSRPAPVAGVYEAAERIHLLCAKFNPEIHDIDDTLSEINQIALPLCSHPATPTPQPAAARGGEDLSGKLRAIRDKFLIPTPDKDHTDYAVLTRCIDALSAKGGS